MAVGGTPRGTSRWLAVLAAVWSGLLWPAAFGPRWTTLPALQAQEVRGPTVNGAHMIVDATENEARVSITYVLHVPGGIDRIPITLLTPEPALVGDLTTVGGGRVSLGEMPLSPTAQRTGWLALTPAAQAEDLDVTVTYLVANATTLDGDRSRTVVPVLAVDWPVAEALPGTFQARIQLPQDMVAYETFPTATGGLALAGTDPGPSEVELSVLPAYLSIRARQGSAPLFSVPRATDLFVVLVLVAMGVWGWSRLGSTRDAAA